MGLIGEDMVMLEEGVYLGIIKHLKDEWRRGCTFVKHLLSGRCDEGSGSGVQKMSYRQSLPTGVHLLSGGEGETYL